MKEETRNQVLKELSGIFDVSESDLKDWEEGKNQIKASSSCLTESELVNLSVLPEDRLEHVHSCEFCTDIFDALIPSEDEINTFIELLQEAQRKREFA